MLRRVVENAKGGDLRAAEVLLRRLWPERKGRPVEVALPPVASAADLVPALAAVVAAMGRGALTAEEAQAMCAVLETQRKAIETAELEARVAALAVWVPGAGRPGRCAGGRGRRGSGAWRREWRAPAGSASRPDRSRAGPRQNCAAWGAWSRRVVRSGARPGRG